MKNLSLRLQKVASYVSKGAFVADVGSDHGALPIFLINEGKVIGAQAIENKKGPYFRLEQAVREELRDQDRIFLSLSSGLDELDPRVNEVVIAGMGGRLIASILEKGKAKLDKVETLILDPHSDWDVLLKKTAELGFKVVEESFFYETDICYSVWRLKKAEGEIRYEESELLFGPLECHRKNDDWKRFIKEKENLYRNLLNNPLPKERKDEILHNLSLLEEIKNEH